MISTDVEPATFRIVAYFLNQVNYHVHTQAKIIVLCIIIFTFLDSRREDKISALNGSKH
jgi:hypothetical protein